MTRYPIAEWMNDPKLCTKEKMESLLTAYQIHYLEFEEDGISDQRAVQDMIKTLDYASYQKQEDDEETWLNCQWGSEMIEFFSILTPDMVAMLEPVVPSSERRSCRNICRSHMQWLETHPNYSFLMRTYRMLLRRTKSLAISVSLGDQKGEIEVEHRNQLLKVASKEDLVKMNEFIAKAHLWERRCEEARRRLYPKQKIAGLKLAIASREKKLAGLKKELREWEEKAK